MDLSFSLPSKFWQVRRNGFSSDGFISYVSLKDLNFKLNSIIYNSKHFSMDWKDIITKEVVRLYRQYLSAYDTAIPLGSAHYNPMFNNFALTAALRDLNLETISYEKDVIIRNHIMIYDDTIPSLLALKSTEYHRGMNVLYENRDRRSKEPKVLTFTDIDHIPSILMTYSPDDENRLKNYMGPENNISTVNEISIDNHGRDLIVPDQVVNLNIELTLFLK